MSEPYPKFDVLATDAQRREALIQAAHKLRMDGCYMQAALVSRLLRESYGKA